MTEYIIVWHATVTTAMLQLWTNSLPVETPAPSHDEATSLSHDQTAGNCTSQMQYSLQYGSAWQSGFLTSTPVRQVQWEHTRATSVN